MIKTIIFFSLMAAAPAMTPPATTPVVQSSEAMQEFTSQLSTLHQQIFLSQFDGDQRAEVLAILLSKSPKYTGVSADEAVEIVLKQSRMQKQVQCPPAQQKSRYSQRRRPAPACCATNPGTNM